MMKLHQDSDAFRVLLETLGDKTDLRIDVLEKDYYVTLLLQELASLQQQGLRAYFKGGTALYKALRSIRRFSEDIDISVDATGLNPSQERKALRRATKEYISSARKSSRR